MGRVIQGTEKLKRNSKKAELIIRDDWSNGIYGSEGEGTWFKTQRDIKNDPSLGS